MVPSIPIRIQDYKDEINANVLALDKYDMVLSMAWLNTYSPTVDYRAKTLSFEHDSKTIVTYCCLPTHHMIQSAA